MTTTASIGAHNSILAPRKSEQSKPKDPINRYLEYKFDENKAQKLAALEKKHSAGEISDFQYKVEKYMIKQSEYQPVLQPVASHINEVA